MSGLVVTGFASLDYPVILAGAAQGDRTTLITRRDPQSWPRVGGCPAYVAAEAARQGLPAAPVTWVGTDTEGDIYCAGLRERGCQVSGVARLDAARSPVALLAYQDDGKCVCLYDPAFGGTEQLTADQRALIAAAGHLAITVGPPQLTGEILSLRRPDARLYWVLKNDPACFPDEIRAELSKQASVIFRNRAERHLVQGTRSETVIVETDGMNGVTVSGPGATTACPIEPVSVADTTGAGDTLAGGYIAAVLQGETDAVAATRKGIRSVHALLNRRAQQERSSP